MTIKRHSIIARLGPTDDTNIDILDKSSLVTEINYIDGKYRPSYGIGTAIEELKKRNIYPTDVAIDLNLLAATVNAADTRISRTIDSQDSWTREIDLYIPVKNLDLWEAQSALLERILCFLTGDIWRIKFHNRHEDYSDFAEKIKPKKIISHDYDFNCVCLFSGGLDSFVGAIDLLADSDHEPLFISHYGDNSTSSQEPCVQALSKDYGEVNLRHVRANIHFEGNLIGKDSSENTTRGRSFMFFSLAALAASGLENKTKIFIPENGLISLNVPLTPLRIGAWSTRTTHPFYMARWQELLNNLGFNAELINPYRFQTKGEMLKGCKNQKLLKNNIDKTLSCSSVSKGRFKKVSKGHCGYCVPCIIRRASVKAAFKKDSTQYVLVSDLQSQPLSSVKPEGEHIRAFQLMHSRISKDSRLNKILVYKTGPLNDYSREDQHQYSDVFERGIMEVGDLLKGVKVNP